MGTRYSSTSVSGYNVSPPADDGSTTAANKVAWATIKSKLTDCFNTWSASINTAILNALDTSCSSITGTYTTLASDNARTLQCSGTFTLSLGDAATLGAGWYCHIVNAGSGTITIGRATGGNTLAGAASNITLAPLQATAVIVNQAANGFNLVKGNGLIFDATDPTKQLIWNVSNVPTGTTLTAVTGSATILPAGLIFPYAGSSIPTGWITCDGSSLLRAGTYAALFAAIGTTWGFADGTHFNVPDFRGRTLIGDGTGAGLTARTLAGSGGEETHQLTTAELASHTHLMQSQGNTGGATVAQGTQGGGSVVSLNQQTGSAGSDTAHNNMQPYKVVKYIISY
jgi:microcystin-dependent protein